MYLHSFVVYQIQKDIFEKKLEMLLEFWGACYYLNSEEINWLNFIQMCSRYF